MEQIHIDLSEGGETVVMNLEAPVLILLTISAGYLGSAFTGSLLLYRGLLGHYERLSLFFLASLLSYMSYLFTSYGSLAFSVGMAWSGGLVISAIVGSFFARYTLLLLGTFLVWYALYDLLDFTWKSHKTDAGILSSYVIEKGWWPALSENQESLTNYISFLWSFLVLSIVAVFARSMLKILQVKETSLAMGEVENEEAMPEKVPPAEINEWLINKGLRWDREDQKILPLCVQEKLDKN